MMDFSCSTVACPTLPLRKAVELVESAGFDGIELRTFGSQPRAFASDPALSAPDKIRALIDGSGIDCSSVATGVTFDAPIWPPVVGRAIADQEQSVREASRAIDLAASIQSPFVRVFGFETYGGERLDSAMKRIAWRLRLACDHARHKGTKLVVENGGAFADAASVQRLVERVDSPYLGACYNAAVGHNAGDDPAAAVSLLGDRLWLARVKDVADGTPVPLGEGDRAIPEFVTALAKARYNGSVVYEWPVAWFEDIELAEDTLPIALERLCGWAGQTAVTRSVATTGVA
ncbi:MAG: sugar phosphate isomerase/epimerase family protein [Planctomycetota bacterium]